MEQKQDQLRSVYDQTGESLQSLVRGSKVMIADLVDRFHPDWAIACSWGKDSMVLTGLTREVYPDIPIKLFFTDTARKPVETYDHVITVLNSDLAPLEVLTYSPQAPLLDCATCKDWKAEAALNGPATFGLKALLVGIRADEHPALADLPATEKIGEVTRQYPLLQWSEEDVWAYMKGRDLPKHPLYAEGYRSIGCAAPCSLPVPMGGGERDGRIQEQDSRRAILRGAGYW